MLGPRPGEPWSLSVSTGQPRGPATYCSRDVSQMGCQGGDSPGFCPGWGTADKAQKWDRGATSPVGGSHWGVPPCEEPTATRGGSELTGSEGGCLLGTRHLMPGPNPSPGTDGQEPQLDSPPPARGWGPMGPSAWGAGHGEESPPSQRGTPLPLGVPPSHAANHV